MFEAIAKMSASGTIVTHFDFRSNSHEEAGKIMVSYYDVWSNSTKSVVKTIVTHCVVRSNCHNKGW